MDTEQNIDISPKSSKNTGFAWPKTKRGLRSEYLDVLESLPDSDEVLSNPEHVTYRKKLDILSQEGTNTFTQEEAAKLGIPALDIWGDFMLVKGETRMVLDITPSKMLWKRAFQEGYADVCELCRKMQGDGKFCFRDLAEEMSHTYSDNPNTYDDPPFMLYIIDTLFSSISYTLKNVFRYEKLECLKVLETRYIDPFKINTNWLRFENREFTDYILHKGYVQVLEALVCCAQLGPGSAFEYLLDRTLKERGTENVRLALQAEIHKVSSIEILKIIDSRELEVEFLLRNSAICSTNPDLLIYVLSNRIGSNGICIRREKTFKTFIAFYEKLLISFIENSKGGSILKAALPYFQERSKLIFLLAAIEKYNNTECIIGTHIPLILRSMRPVFPELLGSVQDIDDLLLNKRLVRHLYEEKSVTPEYILHLSDLPPNISVDLFTLMYTYHKAHITLEFRNFLISEYRRRGRSEIVAFLKSS